VIAGAGIDGLAVAIGLRRAGWQPVLLERSPYPGEIGAGLTLWSNALDALGVGEATRNAGTLQGGGGIGCSSYSRPAWLPTPMWSAR